MPFLIFPNGSLPPNEPLQIIDFLQGHDSKRRLFKTIQGSVYELKALDSSAGSVFSGDNVISDGSVLVAAPFDPLWATITFNGTYKNLYELGLGEEHPEYASMLKDWALLKTFTDRLALMSDLESVSDFFIQMDTEKAVSLLEERYLSPECTQLLPGHKLFKTVTNDKLFAQRWGLENTGSSHLSKAFALEILSEFIPAVFLDSLAKRAGLTFQPNVSLGKKINEIKTESAAAKPIIPKKRGGKAAAAAVAEDKTNKRITSFFKPKS